MIERMAGRIGRMGGIVALGGLLAACGCSVSKDVWIAYTNPPDHPEVFKSDRAEYKVCVGTVDVKWLANIHNSEDHTQQMLWEMVYQSDGDEAGPRKVSVKATSREETLRGGQLWENAIRSLTFSLLQSQAGASGKNIVQVDRAHLEEILKERDLRIADIIQGRAALDKVKVLDIDMLVVGQIDGETVIQKERVSHWWAYPANVFIPGYDIPTHGWAMRRVMTFAGNLQVIDMRTGKIWLTHDMAGQNIVDKKPIPFARDNCSEIHMQPQEEHIRAMLDLEVRKFVGRMLPVPLEIAVAVKSSSNEECRKAVESLDIDNEDALARFKAATADEADDDSAWFGAGLASELLDRLEDARGYYKRAVTIKGVKARDDKARTYADALKRVEERIARKQARTAMAAAKK